MRRVLGHLSAIAAMRRTYPRVTGVRSPLCLGLYSQITSFPCQVRQVPLALSRDGARLNLPPWYCATANRSSRRRCGPCKAFPLTPSTEEQNSVPTCPQRLGPQPVEFSDQDHRHPQHHHPAHQLQPAALLLLQLALDQCHDGHCQHHGRLCGVQAALVADSRGSAWRRHSSDSPHARTPRCQLLTRRGWLAAPASGRPARVPRVPGVRVLLPARLPRSISRMTVDVRAAYSLRSEGRVFLHATITMTWGVSPWGKAGSMPPEPPPLLGRRGLQHLESHPLAHGVECPG